MKKIKPCVLRSCALQIAWVCLFFSLLPLLSGCTKPLVEYSLVRYDWFDTVVSVKGYEDKEEHFDRAMEVALPMLDTYHKLLDIYHTYEGVTNLATLNQMAGKGEVKVSKELMDFLLFSKEMHQKTNGKVNIAMGSVLSIWHSFREDVSEANAQKKELPPLPTQAILQDAALHANIDDLVCNEVNMTVSLLDDKMSLDGGALAKGYVAELVARALTAQGFTHYAIDLGGNIRLLGPKTEKKPWTVGIKDPFKDTTSYIFTLSAHDTSLVTSGSYQRYVDYGGVRYHHIIDPDTLYPAEGDIVSVSVRTPHSGMADAFSTYLFLLSPEEGKEWLEAVGDIEAFWIKKDGSVAKTAGW